MGRKLSRAERRRRQLEAMKCIARGNSAAQAAAAVGVHEVSLSRWRADSTARLVEAALRILDDAGYDIGAVKIKGE